MTLGSDPSPLLEVSDLRRYFPLGAGLFRPPQMLKAVDGVSFTMFRGQSLGLVGESGCGKTTTARIMLQLDQPTGGEVRFKGEDVTALSRAAARHYRSRVQMVFQDPFESLNPRHKVAEIVARPMLNFGIIRPKEAHRTVVDLLERVGLSPGETYAARYPHQLSGGQRQRVSIAAAIGLKPDLIIADEPVASLDISVRAQVLNLLADLQAELGMSYLFISHDLAIVRSFCRDAAVMYLGKIVETAPSETLFSRPAHPYTRALIAASPVADPVRARQRVAVAVQGEVPSLARPPSGCHFHPRCPIAQPVCKTEAPPLRTIGPAHRAACHFAE